jgi:hypothetical protein
MGATFCDIHEATGGIEACEHIYSVVCLSKSEQSQKLLKAEINEIILTRLVFTKTLLLPGVYAYCDKCSKDFSLNGMKFSNPFTLFLHLPKFLRFKDKTKFTCGECIYEIFFHTRIDKFESYPDLENTKAVLKN